MKVTVGNREWSVSCLNDEVYALKEIWNQNMYRLPDGFELKGNSIIDVGANVGGFSVYASEWPNRGHIIAFEPNPVIFPLLIENTLDIPNYERVNAALSDHSGTSHMLLKGENTGSGKLSEAGQYKVPVKDAFAALVNRHVKDIDVLKIDTEGSEVPILQSLRPYLRWTRLIMLEWHCAEDLETIMHLLSGFTITVNARSTEIGTLEAINAHA